MSKTTKWVLIAVIAIGVAIWGIYSLKPKTNKDIPTGPMPTAGAPIGRGGQIFRRADY
jgi:hypothetical protein